MDTMHMTIEEIRNQGKKLGFSYIQTLSVYLYERILYWISQQPFQDKMWLRRSDFYEKGKKKRTAPNQIVYYMRNISYQELEQTFKYMFSRKEEQAYQIQWEMLFLDKQIEVALHIRLEKVAIPFKIIIRPVWFEEQFPEKEVYHFLLWEGKTAGYRAYPVELYVAESFYEVLDKLELISDMKVYNTLYEVLHSYAVDGRRAYLNMSEIFKYQPMSSVEKRWDTILGYKDYTYMKKRWDRYRKSQKEEEVPWEECILLLEGFFTPIWKAVQEDTIFVGDWMPHLGRFLV